MSRKRQPIRAMIRISQKISRKFLREIKKQFIWLLRTIFSLNSRREAPNAGFVLPTVAMVSVVVVLLTIAIMFRSFDRAKNASNVRVNEAVISAATPAIDRAKAKLNKLFVDKRLPRATPSDNALYKNLSENINEYTFGDETALKLRFDINGDGSISEPTSSTLIEDTETLTTAWRFPVDTDNNGKFDSYTLYGIYVRNPPLNNSQYTRQRKPLEARTPPMSASSVSGGCNDTAGTSAALVGINGWFKVGSKLKKSLFVYTATVPITSTPTDTTNYEQYKGNKGFSAVEYQQDRVQIPPTNNAVIYEDDLEIYVGSTPLRLNGRIFTNSNILTGSTGGTVRFYQVSSPYSCYYEAENAKIIVGGNVASGTFFGTGPLGTGTTVDLFGGSNTAPSLKPSILGNTSVTDAPRDLAYNSIAYVKRINKLADAQFANAATTDPDDVKQGILTEQDKVGYTTSQYDTIRLKQLKLYFKERTRRVPFIEVPFDTPETLPSTVLQGSVNTLRPIDAWIYPFAPSDGKTSTSYSKLTLNTSGSTMLPGATEPINKLQKELLGVEKSLGDRALIGNNLPETWWKPDVPTDTTVGKFVGPNIDDTQEISGINWDLGTGTRTRRSAVQTLADLGDTDRNGDWEIAAAQIPNNLQDPVGGLRVVTGAGIYLPRTYTAASTSFTSASSQIWSDAFPVPQATDAAPPPNKTIKPYWMYGFTSTNADDISSLTYTWREIAANNTTTPYLRMRATAVYHYKSTGYSQTSPTPIACVSSFYVPTNSTTAKNKQTYPTNATTLPGNTDADGLSNNGIVYGPPTKTESDYTNLLNYQKNLTYPPDANGNPNGRLVNEQLQNALATGKTDGNRTYSEKSAIHAAICALQIMDGSITPVTTNPPIPHGAIKEIAFLDSRQIKTNQTSTTNQTTLPYDLPLKDREPLEIRSTVLDVGVLRTTTIGASTPAQEYLLPNSGIIYATRDDALQDLSAPLPTSGTDAQKKETQKTESSVDYKLDPNRRPNGIVLTNGSQLFRGATNTYREAEKGFILATNLPVYVKGNFNLHTKQEFKNPAPAGLLAVDWSNFYDRTAANLDPDFACRPGDPRISCPTGDEWRSAVVLADSVTLLSGNYRFGFRDEGDYDWNNSGPTTVPTSFSAFNSYVPVANWRDTTTNKPKDLVADVTGDATTTGFQGSSYLNNFVTPIVLRVPSAEYYTEVCIGSDCTKPENWILAQNCPGLDNNGVPKAVGQSYTVTDNSAIGTTIGNGNKFKTGTILDDPATWSPGCPKMNSTDPRRMVFVRESTSPYNLVVPLKVIAPDTNNTLQIFTLGSTISDAGTQLQSPPNNVFTPWLKPTVSGSNVTWTPVLQINQPFATPAAPNNTDIISKDNGDNNWLQTAITTTFNLISAAGDTPARPTEDNGGLANFVRFMENWYPKIGSTATNIPAKISGAFMQTKRSAYATGPYATILENETNNAFKYSIDLNNRKSSGYLPPDRQWGYDVALLSQSPDLFSQKLVTTPADLPNEYFREVGRDDTWVKNLLCAKTIATGTPNAIDTDQRPSGCP